MLLQHLAGGAMTNPLAGTIAERVWLLPILPLIGFVLNGLLSVTTAYHPGPADPTAAPHDATHGGTARDSHADDHAPAPRHRHAWLVSIIGPASVALAFVVAVALFLAMPGEMTTPFLKTFFSWIPVGPELQINWAFQLDQLSMIMVLVITGVGTLIHIFSIGYMQDDPGYARFFAYMNLFVAFMLVLVLGSSFPVMFVGWEGVGLCSYLLIGFWFNDAANASAGLKAFIVNRIGDFGFLTAMFLIWSSVGSLDFTTVAAHAGSLTVGGPVVTAICLLLFLGCAGKSAQIPLYVWLPDAMAGPTPVSALIHAATMVTAGVYLVARTSFLFAMAPAASLTVAVVGAVTALFAATIGLKQWDIKKVLAYSTVSQLGYMFLGVGVGAFSAGIWHVMSHAFFKGLLFLGAGAVIHGLHGEQDMRQMGGLW
ncbi:MAG: NADH-quinone oxidoreductase subunit L, partial [Gemmatimonadaceae bacterium]